MTDDIIPDNVDLRWIARLILEIRGEFRDLRAAVGPVDGSPGDRLRGLSDEMRRLHSDFGAMNAILRRVEDNLTACRDEVRQFCEQYRDPRGR